MVLARHAANALEMHLSGLSTGIGSSTWGAIMQYNRNGHITKDVSQFRGDEVVKKWKTLEYYHTLKLYTSMRID